MRIRLLYTAEGALRWASHLDVVSELTRLFFRARIDVEYSKGFGHKPKFHYAPPRPTGASSLWEIADADLSSIEPLADFAYSADIHGVGVFFEATPATSISTYPRESSGGISLSFDDSIGIPEFEPPEWWNALVSKEYRISTSGKTGKMAGRLSTFACPGMRILGLRELDESEPAIGRLVKSALFKAVFKLGSPKEANELCDTLKAGDWIVQAGREGKSRNIKELAANISVDSKGHFAGLFLSVLVLPSATFPVMKLVNLLTSKYGLIPVCVSRELLLDELGSPIS